MARPARLAACARPRLRSSVIASSMLPFASVSAALHSIMPAPVLSRSCFTWSAVISAIVESLVLSASLRLRSLRRWLEGPDRRLYKQSAGSVSRRVTRCPAR